MVTLDLYDTLERAWRIICQQFDVTGDLPGTKALFAGADLSAPPAAAETVLVNMLAEAMELVGRFSPWYRQPARAFGLVVERGPGSGRVRWRLSGEALRAHRVTLDALTLAIGRNVGLILATDLVDDLERPAGADVPCVMAACRCRPPRTILVARAVIAEAEIVCDACHQPFELAGEGTG